jgi:hypothetical protein
MKRIVLLAATALLLGGCGFFFGGITGSDPFQSQSERRLSVRVENLNGDDMAVRALAAGRRVELGRVQALSVRQFSIPWARRQDVRFQIEPIAGRSHTTQSVPVGPGEFVSLLITEPITRSQLRR